MKVVLVKNEYVEDIECARCGEFVNCDDNLYMLSDSDGIEFDGPYCCKVCADRDLTEYILRDERLSNEESTSLLEKV